MEIARSQLHYWSSFQLRVVTPEQSNHSDQSFYYHFFMFARPTGRLSREGGRWEKNHFIGVAILLW